MAFFTRFTFSLIFIVLMSNHCFAQQQFSGRLLSITGKPVVGSIIKNSIGQQLAVTTSTGNFSFLTSGDSVQVSFETPGRQPILNTVYAGIFLTITSYAEPATLPALTFTAFANNTIRNQSGSSVSRLELQLLQLPTTISLVQAFNTTAGVKMDERSPGSYRLNIRNNVLRSAFGVRNVKLYWDDASFTDAGGTTLLNLLPAQFFTGAQIIKGQAGSMYGAGTGGVILLKSRLDTVTQPKLTAAMSYGNFGTYSLNAAYEKGGKHPLMVSIIHQEAGGYRAQSSLKKTALVAQHIIFENTRQALQLNVLAANLQYGTPGGLTLQELQIDRRQARPAAGTFAGAEIQNASVHLRSAFASLNHTFSEGHFKNALSIFSNYTSAGNLTIRNAEDKYNRGIGLREVANYAAGDVTLTAGFELQTGFDYLASRTNMAGVQGKDLFTDRIYTLNTTAFLQGSVLINSTLKLTAGVSTNALRYRFNRIDSFGFSPSPYKAKAAVVPRLAIVKQFKAGNIYATVSKGFSPPSIDEVHAGNDVFTTSLKPEQAVQAELGTALYFNEKLTATLAIYTTQTRQTIVGRRNAAGGDFYENAGSTLAKGIEQELKYRFKGGYLFTNNTLVRNRFNNYLKNNTNLSNNTLPGVANYTGTVGGFIAGRHLQLLTYITHTGKLFLNDENSVSTKPYQIVVIEPTYQYNKNRLAVQFFASLRLSLQQQLSLGNDLNAAGNRFYNPAAPQLISVGLSVGQVFKKM